MVGQLNLERPLDQGELARMRGFDPVDGDSRRSRSAPVDEQARAQDEWDAIVTAPRLRRARAERILAEIGWRRLACSPPRPRAVALAGVRELVAGRRTAPRLPRSSSSKPRYLDRALRGFYLVA
jgi:hypothetical protein